MVWRSLHLRDRRLFLGCGGIWARLLDALDPEWRLFFELLAATGLRIGEALELRCGDLDLGAKRLRVSRQVSKDGVVSPPKTNTGVRAVPLSTATCQRL